jgi:hypothetical protein
MKGGSLVHMSGYGLSNHLDIKFRTDSNGKVAMNYMECYVPFPSDIIPENLEGFIDAKTGVMDVNKMLEAGVIEQNFLDLIAYRIPTEAKYSV